jgi:hypothetical protein
MQLTGLADSIDPSLKLKHHNPYYARQINAYINQWPALLEKTMQRLETLPLRLVSYHAGDAVEWLPTIPATSALATFLPFFGGDYDKMFGKIDRLFDWDKPSYQELFGDRLERFIDYAINRDHWAIGSPKKIDRLQKHLRGIAQTTNRGKPIYVYTSADKTRVVAPHQQTQTIKYPRLTTKEAIGSKLTIAPLTTAEFQTLRSIYMNAFIRPGAPTVMFGVFVDGKLIGAFAFMRGYKDHSDPDSVYLLSDFPVAPTDYPRLSKLVLYAALSKESRLYAERIHRARIRHMVTTAFTDNPVSMKYRGLFKLTSRKENPDYDPAAKNRYKLQYAAAIGTWTLEEGFAQWQNKHASTRAPSESTPES